MKAEGWSPRGCPSLEMERKGLVWGISEGLSTTPQCPGALRGGEKGRGGKLTAQNEAGGEGEMPHKEEEVSQKACPKKRFQAQNKLPWGCGGILAGVEVSVQGSNRDEVSPGSRDLWAHPALDKTVITMGPRNRPSFPNL